MIREYDIGGKRLRWVRFGTFSFPSFHLGIDINKFQFSLNLIFFWIDLEF